MSDIQWSQEQLNIFDACSTLTENIAVNANAGCAKTTTMVEAFNRSIQTVGNTSIRFLAFGKPNAEDLKKKLADPSQASTFHSLMLGEVKRVLGNGVKVEGYKNSVVFESLYPAPARIASQETKDRYYSTKSDASKLCGLIKNTLTDFTSFDAIWNLVNDFALDFEYPDDVVEAVYKMMPIALADDRTIDFDDMLYYPYYRNYNLTQYGAICLDESQDTNLLQIALIKKFANRLIAIGDPNQAIYAWRGADASAFYKIVNDFGGVTLPLSTNYRCDTDIIALAQTIVPSIKARPGAGKGIIREMANYHVTGFLLDEVEKQNNPLVICRVNYPLVPQAFELLRHGIPAYVKGSDIGKNLISLAKKVSSNATSLNGVYTNLANWESNQINHIIDNPRIKNAQAMITGIEDKVKTLEAILNGVSSVSAVVPQIERMFKDEGNGVVLSSIHRIKGGEGDSVVILRPDLIPHPKAVTEVAKEQEKNLKYVAITRARHELIFTV